MKNAFEIAAHQDELKTMLRSIEIFHLIFFETQLAGQYTRAHIRVMCVHELVLQRDQTK